MNISYSFQVVWSNEDGAYVAFPAELPGCIADGQTPEEAVANLKVVIEEWIETAKEENRPVPPPMSVEDFSLEQQKNAAAFQQQIQNLILIQQEAAKAAQAILEQFGHQPRTYLQGFCETGESFSHNRRIGDCWPGPVIKRTNSR